MASKSSSTSIFDFISKLNTVTIERLYGKGNEGNAGSWACKALYQSLSQLGKNYVMRLLFVTAPIDAEELQGWVYSDCRDIHYQTIKELKKFRILLDFHDDFGGSKKTQFIMNKYFQKGLQFAITNPIEPWSDTSAFQALKIDKSKPSAENLETNSVSQWNEVLLTLLSMPIPRRAEVSESDYNMKRQTINNFLIASNLMVKFPGTEQYQISADGYEYVLKDHQGQVWTYILEYLNRMSTHDEALSLLFMLSYCTLGEGYPIDALTKLQQQLIFEFSHFGIIYIHSVKSSRFYPCNVAINLIFHTEKLFVTQETVVQARALTIGTVRSVNLSTVDLKIIVQTNCDVVAYISNDLHYAMLNIFVDVKIKLPNMAMGKITREKVRDAYKRGIKVTQILDFLTLHAHPITANREHVVPLNIQDQLALWYAEQYRISDADAVVISCSDIIGMNETTFTTLFGYANDRLDCVLWADLGTLTFAVTSEGYEQLSCYAQDELSL